MWKLIVSATLLLVVSIFWFSRDSGVVEVVVGETEYVQTGPGKVETNLVKKTRKRKRKEGRDIERFMSWVMEQGAMFNFDITLEKIDGYGLGIVAHEDVPRNAQYLTMPYNLLIGRDNILNDKYVGHVFKDLAVKFGGSIKYEIIMYLLYHKHVLGKRSYYYPFISILPKSFPNCPIFYKDEDLELLRGDDLYQKIQKQREKYRRQYEGVKRRVFDIYPEYFPPSKITFQEFLWGNWIYSSRLFFIEGREPREHLLPLADMVNCYEPTPKEDLTFVEDTGRYLELRADRSFAAGDQIFESYGYKSNSESFQFEGFILEDTPNDCVWMDADGEKGRGKKYKWKDAAKEIFKFHSPPPYCFSATNIKNNVAGRWLEYFRFLVSDNPAEERKRGHRSSQNDKKAFTLLLDIVEDKLVQNRYDVERDKNNEHLAVRYMVFVKKQLLRLQKELLKVVDGFRYI